MAQQKENNYLTIRVPRMTKTQVFVTGSLMVVSFLIGSFFTKIQYLEKIKTQGLSNTIAAVNNPSGNTTPAPQARPEDTTPKKVSVDDDPVLGKSDAPVTLVEFSDYECPFCKRHFDDAYPQLKKEYIDTGKVKLVFRDLPLSFHDPMATTEAVAANCARAQGDDITYFKYHDEIFTRTKSNGNGLTKEDLYTISDDLGLNTEILKSCIEDTTQADEVKKDLADANAVGASATPTFFIGRSDASGIITGTPIVGAQPYSAFKTAIDKLLN